MITDAETYSAECYVAVCMFVIAAGLTIYRSSVQNRISAATIAGIAVLYGVLYYLMAITVLTEKTMFLGILFVVLEAYTTVMMMKNFNEIGSFIAHRVMSTIFMVMILLSISRIPEEKGNLLYILVLIHLFISNVLTMILEAFTHRRMSILAIESICVCGMIVLESMRIMDLGVKYAVSVEMMMVIVMVILRRMLFPPSVHFSITVIPR